jgi:hypothetical protein
MPAYRGTPVFPLEILYVITLVPLSAYVTAPEFIEFYISEPARPAFLLRLSLTPRIGVIVSA